MWSLTLIEHIILAYGKRPLKRIFPPKLKRVRREWRKLYNKELLTPYFSPNIIRMIKSRKLIRAGHITHVNKMRNNDLRDFSPPANYTDRATAACLRSYCQL
jgi:hypothetical protein